jgi:hypothetical protein
LSFGSFFFQLRDGRFEFGELDLCARIAGGTGFLKGFKSSFGRLATDVGFPEGFPQFLNFL